MHQHTKSTPNSSLLMWVMFYVIPGFTVYFKWFP